MLRLTLLLCAVMFGALLIAGEDRGQLRPGLAKAAEEGRYPAPEPAVVATAEVEPAAPAPASEPAAKPRREVVAASYTPEKPETEEPARPTVVADRVFTLSTLQTRVEDETAAADPSAEAPAVAEGEGTIWYVVADSVNVRSGPSTDTDVVGKLSSGEATLVVWQENDEWARIVIQGDGVEGFVATRFLSQTEP
jgi:hypothetical protein